MAEIIRMPLLSDTMKEGVIAAWHKKVGDKVKSDDIIAEVETDKATMEVMPYVDGTVLFIAGEKGVAIPINGIMAIVGDEGEDIQSLLDENKNTKATSSNNNSSASGQDAIVETEQSIVNNSEMDIAIPDDVTVVRMPLLSDTMKEGKIVSWLKNVGDDVKSDDILAEVETDKATMEVMGYADGTLLHIGTPTGEAAKINDIIAIIGPKSTNIDSILSGEKTKSATKKEPLKNIGNKPEENKSAQNTEVENIDKSDGRIKISPLARKMAKDRGIDFASLTGTGDGGRIVKRDIEGFTPEKTISSEAKSNAQSAMGQESYNDVPLSQMRKIIAQRLSESKFGAPHFYLKMSVKMDNSIKARKAMNEVSETKISFNDFIIKACAMALRKHPSINSSWMGNSVRTYDHIHIGSAVAVDEGLIVPVIKHADIKSLSQIATDANTLIDKARNKKLQPQEFTGNTFTISNLGMMDIDEFTAIINPPDSCILAVGKIEPTPVVENGEIVVRHILKLTLSCDHRVVDGAVGARFLQTLKSYLEQPVNMLV